MRKRCKERGNGLLHSISEREGWSSLSSFIVRRVKRARPSQLNARARVHSPHLILQSAFNSKSVLFMDASDRLTCKHTKSFSSAMTNPDERGWFLQSIERYLRPKSSNSDPV